MHKLPLILAGALALAACSSTTQAIRVPRIGMVARDLERNEYVVLGTAEGKSCIEQTCLLGAFCSMKDEGGKSVQRIGLFSAGTEVIGAGDVLAAAEEQAILKALQAQPESDAVFAPRKSTTLEVGNMIISTSTKACVHVFGKSVRIKTDGEIGGAAAAAAPAVPAVPAVPAAVVTPPVG